MLAIYVDRFTVAFANIRESSREKATDEDNRRLLKCLNCCFSVFWLVFLQIEQDEFS